VHKACKILDGIRVLDFGSFMAGPAAAEFLGFLGAEVIKVEHPMRPDGTRYFLTSPTQLQPDPRCTASQTYDLNNYGKLDVSIDYSIPEGAEVLWGLIEKTDIFIQNMSVGAMAKYGFGYEEVAKHKPDIIYLSSSACGDSGPEVRYVGYAGNFATKAGLGATTGYPGSPPSVFVGSIDLRSTTNAVVSILSALLYKKKTGEGQLIEIASQEALASQLGDIYLDYIVNGNSQGPMANTRPGYAPQGAYRTTGKDQWVAISVENDKQWQALCKAMGKPELAGDARFATYKDRFSHIEELDAIITEWTSTLDKMDAFKVLQDAGVPAGPVYDGEGLYKDPDRIARRSFYMIDSRDLGQECMMTPPWRYEKTPIDVEDAAPYLGEHTTQVLKKLLGKSDKELKELADKHAIRRLLDYDTHL
jgi:crotonobetainyl-CoA:carnitine CoA-transferase CaiB-like acyl-CoA transferase